MSASAPAEPEAVRNGAAAQGPGTDGRGGREGTNGVIATRAHYAPPWADVSIIGIAGSSGSGKSTLSQAIVKQLNLPWVVILSIVSPSVDKKTRVNARPLPALLLSCFPAPLPFPSTHPQGPSDWRSSRLIIGFRCMQDSFYKSLDEESSMKAFRNEYDFDSPDVS